MSFVCEAGDFLYVFPLWNVSIVILFPSLNWRCAGMGIYDAMKLCKADVSTVCLGLAASMGAFLLASGTKGKRFCMPNARVMIHQPLGTAGGKVSTFCWSILSNCLLI